MPLSDFSINPPQSDLWDLSGTRKDGETRVGATALRAAIVESM